MKKKVGSKSPILPLPRGQEGVALSSAEELVKEAIKLTRTSGQNPLRVLEEMEFRPEF